MPIYEYKREDGTTFEIQQPVHEMRLVSCPTTGQRVSLIFNTAALRFKGKGFHATDYPKKCDG